MRFRRVSPRLRGSRQEPCAACAVTDAWRLQPSWTQRPPDAGCPSEAVRSEGSARCRLALSAHPPGAGGCDPVSLEVAVGPFPPWLVTPPVGDRVLGQNGRRVPAVARTTKDPPPP